MPLQIHDQPSGSKHSSSSSGKVNNHSFKSPTAHATMQSHSSSKKAHNGSSSRTAKPSHTSSKKAYNGSSRSNPSKSTNHSSKHKFSDHDHPSTQDPRASYQPVDRLVNDARDVRSYHVRDYDPYQEAERKRKEEVLRGVVGRDYEA
jgi:hypothetical protein